MRILIVAIAGLMLLTAAARAGVGLSLFWIGAPGGGAPAAAPACLLDFPTFVCAGGIN